MEILRLSVLNIADPTLFHFIRACKKLKRLIFQLCGFAAAAEDDASAVFAGLAYNINDSLKHLMMVSKFPYHELMTTFLGRSEGLPTDVNGD